MNMAWRSALCAVAFVGGARADRDHRRLGCTALAIDSAATEGGVAMAGMNADCSNCDGRLAWVEGKEFPEGAMRKTYVNMGSAPRWVGYGRGAFYEPKKGQAVTPEIGSIPQVRRTFGYWEAILPLMNEKGLAMGESSCSARLVNQAAGTPGDAHVDALLDITTIMELAMERCETARCAVETMGALSEEYGFFPMANEWSPGLQVDGTIAWDDAGEAVTLSDEAGEAWVFHVVGGLKGRKAKSIWAAMRLPKGHAAFVANHFIIRELPEQPTEDMLFSLDARGTAEAAGFWHPSDGVFDFTRVFAPDSVTFQTPAGQVPIPLYESLRLWRLINLMQPSVPRALHVDPLAFPPSVPVDGKLNQRTVQNLLREYYNGTEFDMTKSALSGPFGSPIYIEGGPTEFTMGNLPRGISIVRTVYGVVGESRPAGRSVMWYAADTPMTSVFVPFYAAAGGAMDPAYGIGTNRKFNRDSAWWAFDFVSNWMMLSFRNMSQRFVFPLIDELQTDLTERARALEARKPSREELADFQTTAQGATVRRWWELADFLIMAYNDGFLNDVLAGTSIGYPMEFMEAIGFNQDVHPIQIKRARSQAIEANPLPQQYDMRTQTWLWAGPLRGGSLAAAAPPADAMLAVVIWFVTLAFAFVAGRWSKRVDDTADATGYVKLGA